MTEDKKSKSWWQTLPGIFSGMAALITAVTGAFLAANQLGFFESEVQENGKTKIEQNEDKDLYFLNRAVTEKNLIGKTYQELDIMRNSIYAYHGRRFNRIDLQEYFNKQTWYKPRFMPQKFPSDLLTAVQKENVVFITSYQSHLQR